MSNGIAFSMPIELLTTRSAHGDSIPPDYIGSNSGSLGAPDLAGRNRKSWTSKSATVRSRASTSSNKIVNLLSGTIASPTGMSAKSHRCGVPGIELTVLNRLIDEPCARKGERAGA